MWSWPVGGGGGGGGERLGRLARSVRAAMAAAKRVTTVSPVPRVRTPLPSRRAKVAPRTRAATAVCRDPGARTATTVSSARAVTAGAQAPRCDVDGGGGGGGGWYGGGGGGAGVEVPGELIRSTRTAPAVAVAPGYGPEGGDLETGENEGDGEVTISYDPVADACGDRGRGDRGRADVHRMTRRRRALAALIAGTVIGAGGIVATPAAAAPTVVEFLSPTNEPFQVPPDVHTITVEICGAQGGEGGNTNDASAVRPLRVVSAGTRPSTSRSRRVRS